MGELVKQGIATNESATTLLFDSLTGGQSFLKMKYKTPSEYVKKYWLALEKAHRPTLRGNVFEYIIYTLLYREGIRPFYTQAQVAFVPNIVFDTILYSDECPVCLSLKTSLRERYKQADLEAIALKYVHRKAKCYLLTMDSVEAKAVRAKIPRGLLIGLDDVIDCNTGQLDDLVKALKRFSFEKSKRVEVVKGNLVG